MHEDLFPTLQCTLCINLVLPAYNGTADIANGTQQSQFHLPHVIPSQALQLSIYISPEMSKCWAAV